MRLNTDEKIRLGMAFNNAATVYAGAGVFDLGKYRSLVRDLYTLYTEEVKYQEDLHDEERRKKDEISKKVELDTAQEIGQTG